LISHPDFGWLSGDRRQPSGREQRAVEALAVGGRLGIGEVEQAAEARSNADKLMSALLFIIRLNSFLME
jgi:hypothetical protein